MIQTVESFVKRAANCVAAVFLIFGSGWAGAKETTLHQFMAGSDGALPYRGGVIGDSQGNLYGTASVGGSGGCDFGCGVVFKLAPDGTETILHDFNGTDGSAPFGTLLADSKGNFYGTTWSGGGQVSAGVVYKLATDGTYTVLYRFCSKSGCTDGEGATGPLMADSSGNLYGTTAYGGTGGDGTVFKITKKGVETVLFSFGGPNGELPEPGGVVTDGLGNLYGATGEGGANGYGAVFKLAPDGTETVLHSFCNYNDGNCTDGSLPSSPLIIDSAGNLYGSTFFGGVGCGVVYKVAPDGTETIVHNFVGGKDGCEPQELTLDGLGDILGVSTSGGDGPKCMSFGPPGCGTVFKITPDGTESVIYAFPTPHRGYQAFAPLFEDNHGNLYGTADFGGDRRPCRKILKINLGCGVVFKVTQ